jgi:hypothetical protein
MIQLGNNNLQGIELDMIRLDNNNLRGMLDYFQFLFFRI